MKKKQKKKYTNKEFSRGLYIFVGCTILAFAVLFFIFKNHENNSGDTVTIPGVTPWTGVEPYPEVIWSQAKPELRSAVTSFEHAWGSPLLVLQVYRPATYTSHIRSAWEMWRYLQGKSYTEGYNCKNYEHINTTYIGTLTDAEKKALAHEALLHGFRPGSTPPACESDHSLGIAVDITPPSDPVLYIKWINTAYSVGLCHYIRGDEPHLALRAYLPIGTDCLVP